MAFRIVFFLLLAQGVFAQDQIPSLLDSLAQSSSEIDKARLSMKIAQELADDDWKRALYYIDIAEKNAQKSKSDSVIANTHITTAYIYSGKEAFDVALDHFLKAYHYYQNKPLRERYELENDLAIAYSQTENREKALEFFRKLSYYEHTKKNPFKSAVMANNIALVWMRKDLDSAMFYFNKSLNLAKDSDNSSFRVFLYTNLARCATLKEEYEEAKKYFTQAIQENNKSNGDKLPWIYSEFSELYLKNNNIDSAIYYAKNAEKILDTLAPFSLMQSKNMEVLYKAYEKTNDFKKASNYFDRFVAITDSLNIEDKRINVQKIVLADEYSTKNKIRELEDDKIRSNIYSFIFGLLALLLIFVILLYQYRNKLKRAELEKRLVASQEKELCNNLELKNKELIGKAMMEMHRSKIIEDILKDLKEVRLKAIKKETQSAIDYITKRLEINTSSSAWDEFELSFEQVHESFYKNLLIKHPDLTPRDKRLCALLKLNLTSKEIAQITGQSSKSVENARTRLRKKLDITNSQTDLSFYLSNLE